MAAAAHRVSQQTVQARHAVQSTLADLPAGSLVLVACSGGPDSAALAAATAYVARRRGLDTHAVVVDHALQSGSAQIAAWACEVCLRLGIQAGEVVPVQVGHQGGPEGAARQVRQAALRERAAALGGKAVLLGHTRDDQAETVLLRLARGSGARSLSAMREQDGLWRRPFLGLPREVVHASAEESLAGIGEQAWRDPHNEDPRFTRSRVRSAMGTVQAALGVDVTGALARTAEQLRDDADALDALGMNAFAERVVVQADGLTCATADLQTLPRALRTRVIRAMCLAASCDPGALTAEHVWTVERLVTDWHGQGPTFLPGGVRADRRYGRLTVHRPPAAE